MSDSKENAVYEGVVLILVIVACLYLLAVGVGKWLS